MRLRTVLFLLSAVLMTIGAAGFTFDIMPDLHGDLIEIGVRPTVLGGTVLHFYFASLAMWAFAAMGWVATAQAASDIAPARLPLAIVAATQFAFGVIAFSRSHSPHHLGPVAMGLLLAAALALPAVSNDRRTSHNGGR